MSSEAAAYYRHVNEHGCGDPGHPNFAGGTMHCPEANRLNEAISPDDPDFPVAFA
ncbi:hypothetical protein [Nocardia wallacei]|uniref:hypothetical protein n=1 Tax=Nocardia wallacei TaxID=480035 RepID=UPI002454E627|nr:hypothetical protein [Nocardia wallacei]